MDGARDHSSIIVHRKSRQLLVWRRSLGAAYMPSAIQKFDHKCDHVWHWQWQFALAHSENSSARHSISAQTLLEQNEAAKSSVVQSNPETLGSDRSERAHA